MPNFCLEWVDEIGRICRLDLVDKVFIGRCCRGIEESRRIVVKDLAVSRDHAIVSLDGAHLQVTDMSKNGVLANDVRVEPGSSRDLTDGDIITVGNTRIAIKLQGHADFDAGMEHTQAGPVEKIVTSLVADVRGFSGFSQREDSLGVYAFMKRVFEAPTARLLSMNSRGPLKTMWAMRFMPFGTMAHYSPGAADLALVGDATNLAFRLSDMANKDLASPIVLCGRTAELVRPVLSPVDIGPAPVRGHSGQEHLYGFDIKMGS